MLFRSLVAVFVAAASFGVASAAVEELIVEKIHVPASCDVKSQNGDMLSMHYVSVADAEHQIFNVANSSFLAILRPGVCTPTRRSSTPGM